MRAVLSEKILDWLLALSVSFAVFAEQSGEAIAQADDKSAVQFYSKIEKPRDLVGLFRNFKVAVDGALLIREDFYTDQHIKQFSGGNVIVWSRNHGPGKEWGEVTDFGAMVQPWPSVGKLLSGLHMSFVANLDEPEGRTAAWSVIIRPPNRLAFVDVERIFGKGWAYGDWTSPSPDAPPPPHPIDPLGNERLIYRADKPGLHWEAKFNLAYDATIEDVRFVMRGVSK